MRDRRRLHNKTFSRAVSLLLGLLMCLEPLSVVALAATSGNIPAVKTTYKPTVVVEGNAVVTGVAEGEEPTTDDLTGFFEVALKVQTAAYVDEDGKQVSYEAYAADPDAYEKKDDIDFGVVAAALKYDASIFTPVSWSATEEIFDPDTGKVLAGAAGLTDISALATDGFASLDAIGPEEMIDGEAVIFESITANEYILNLSAWAKREHVRYDEPTAVVVVRFAYNKSERPMLTKDTESGQYVLGADNRPTTKTVLWLATDEEANDSDSDQSVWYDGDHYDPDTLTPRDAAYYYYVASEEGATTPTTTPSTKGNVDVTYVDAAGATKTATILDPNTVGKKVLSLYYPPSGAAPSSDPPSYLDNVLSQGLNSADYASLVFDFVNAPSFLTSGVDLGDLSVIIFVDWDNTILGTLVVTKETDIRERVNSYVATHLIHPDLKAPADPSLLTREASYRGKYPTTPMSEAAGAGDKSVDPEGENYPLTNKLDYVFFKRPMEFVDTDTDTIADTWQQMGTTDTTGTGATTATWDDKYPFIYGWASCTLENYEDTWTTLGMGELADYSGSSIGGYHDIGTNPATFTYDSDALTFQFLDCKEGVTTDVVVAKAVYEPGVDLLSREFTYRMVGEPYYNKLNDAAANNGGAYSVDLTYERAVVYSDGKVYGVARLRDPYVRQDTTTDLRWEENADFGIKNDLPNATNAEAAGKTKTTYTKVETANQDIITFSLTLSARQNKVDYALVEAYGANFVAGGQRTAANSGYIGEAQHVLDNYNYYVSGDSDEDDIYFDAVKYTDREGSHGFVLYGTLNNIMERATIENTDPAAANTLNLYVTSETLGDINLRKASGDKLTSSDYPGLVELRTAIKEVEVKARAAADAAATATEKANYWNSELECVELSYHQLQLYVVEKVLYDRATADGRLIGWCHLHEACAALSSGKPKNWDELIEAVKAGEAGELLSFREMDDLAGLRSDADGTPYTDPDLLIADISTAITALGVDAPTWDMVQGHILDKTIVDADVATQKSYDAAWWYDNGTKPTDFASVLAAAQYVNGTDPTRNARLNALKEAFDQVTDPDAPDNTKWNDLTDNLMAGESVDAETGLPITVFFDDFDDFVATLKTAVSVLAEDASATHDGWKEVQYFLIHDTYSKGTEAEQEEMAGYWWYKNGKPIVDTQTMLEAASSNSAAWQSFTAADLYALKGLSFSKDFAGTRWTDDDFAIFKTLVEQIAVRGADQTWNQIQYRIIHRENDSTPYGGIGDDIASDEGNTYYWWVGGTKAEDLDPLEHITTNVKNGTADWAEANTLVNMAFRIKYNGIPVEKSGLTDAYLKAYRLQKTLPTEETADYTANLFTTTDITTLLDRMGELLENAETAGNGTKYTPPTLNWFQVQYALLADSNGAYGAYLAAPEGDLTAWKDYDANDRYWWRLQDNNPNNANTVSMFDRFLGYLYQLGKAKATGGSYNLATSYKADYPDIANLAVFLSQAEMNIKRVDGGNYANNPLLTQTVTAMGTLAQTIYKNEGGVYNDIVDTENETFKLTWYQVQYAMLHATRGKYKTAAEVDGLYNWAPDWVTSASSASVMSLRPTVYEDQYTVETTVSEDGLTTTVTETLGTWNADLGDYDWTITTTVTQQVGEATVTTITVTTMTYDPETWQPIFDTTTQTLVTTPETGDATYGLEEDTDLTPVQPEDNDSQTPEESDPADEDETQTSNGGDQTYQTGADTVIAPVETTDEAAAEGESADESESETGAVSAASAGLLSLAWRTNGTGPGISLASAGPVATLRVTGILDTGQLFGSQRDGPLGILPSRSNLPTVPALLANRRIRT